MKFFESIDEELFNHMFSCVLLEANLHHHCGEMAKQVVCTCFLDVLCDAKELLGSRKVDFLQKLLMNRK